MAKFVITDQFTVTIGGASLADHIAAISIDAESNAVSSTAYGQTWETNEAGIKSGSVTVSFHQDYAASKVAATLGPLLGGTAAIAVSGTAGGTTVAGTATARINQLKLFGGAVGDLATLDVTWPTTGAVTGFGLS